MTRSRDVADTQDNLGGAVAPFVAGKNAIVGGMDIWQRGTSFAYGGSNVVTYTTDRWFVSSGSNAYTISRVASGLPNFQYAARIQRNSGSTTTSAINFMYGLETADSMRFAGQEVTVSFYARAGANFSASGNTIFTPIISGTGTDQNINSGFTGQATVNNKGQVLTTSWQRFTVSGTVGSTATQLAFYLASTPTGTAGANDYYDVTGVQMELGSVATPFSRAGGSIGGELALCQRYYFRATSAQGGVYSQFTSFAPAYSSTNASMPVPVPVTMRANPTSVDYSTVILTDGTNFISPSSVSIDSHSSAIVPKVSAGATGLTATTRSYSLWANNSSTAYLGISAEL